MVLEGRTHSLQKSHVRAISHESSLHEGIGSFMVTTGTKFDNVEGNRTRYEYHLAKSLL